MKKIILSAITVVTLAIGFTSCKDSKTPEVTKESVEKVEAVTSDTPKFADADVQAYVASYEAYIAKYKEAVESKDMTKMQSLGKMAQDLATKSQSAMSKVSGDDAKKLTEYMTKKSKELQDLAMKMSGN